MAEIRDEDTGKLFATLMLDDEESIDLMPVNSSQVAYVGFYNDEAYIKYRDALWSYPSTKEEYDRMLASPSIGKYVNAVYKPRTGKRII